MLKHIYDKKEEIPEAVAALYREEGGTFVLDVDTSERIQEFRNKNIEVIKEANALRLKLEAFGDLTPEAAQALREEKAQLERQELLKKGDVEALITKERERFSADWNKRLELVQAENANLQKTLIQLKVTDELKSAAAAAYVRPEAIPDVVELAAREWVLVDGVAVRKRGEETVFSKREPGKNQGM